MRKNRSHNDDETEVDMTPMLDIVFIMLIFFIVTTSFVKESGIIIDRPADKETPDNPPPPTNRPIVIEIDDMSEIHIEGRDVQVSGVRSNVENLRSKRPKAVVIVQAHEKAKTGVVVSAVDQAKQAGADKVTVVKPNKKK